MSRRESKESRETRETAFRALAKHLHHAEGELEIDDNAKVSCADPKRGAYVQAWVWVDAPGSEDGS